MLKPTSDRLDYSAMLTPPPGYETSFAVGTTYSLDLDALIGISIALGLSETIDSGLKDNPIYLLEALQKTADKILVFCEGGQIKAPANAHSLHILLEKMVYEVVMKNKKSFHPKFWLAKYEHEYGEALYRCLILSRNLTFDRSWDVAVCLEGVEKSDGRYKNGYPKSRPVSDFLQSLLKLLKRNEIHSDKRRQLSKLANEILNVKFKIDDKPFSDFQFCPVGIDGYNIESTELFENYHELFIMSPFLTDSTIEAFNKNALTSPNPNILITRKSELAKLNPQSVTRFDVYAMKDVIVDGEETLSEGEQDSSHENEKQQQDIHAKVYLKTKYANSELFIGSLNASKSACYGNIEFMLKLFGKKRYLSVDQLKRDIFGESDKDNPFEKVDITLQDEGEESEAEDLQKIIKDLLRVKSAAKVIEEGEKYAIEVTFENIPDRDDISISPLLSNKIEYLSGRVVFHDLHILQLSEFYVIKVGNEEESISRVIKIQTDDIPDGRESAVVNSIIKDKSGFIQYLTFLLGDDYLLAFLENNLLTKNQFVFGNGEPIPALYEKMLKAAVHSPHKFEEIKRLLILISDDQIIPDGFKGLYDVFEKVVNKACR
jgi:hypothetical protein